MPNKPRIRAFCEAGCAWETVHREDFLKSAAIARAHLNKQNEHSIFEVDAYNKVRLVVTNELLAPSLFIGLFYYDTNTQTYTTACNLNVNIKELLKKDRKKQNIDLQFIRSDNAGTNGTFLVELNGTPITFEAFADDKGWIETFPENIYFGYYAYDSNTIIEAYIINDGCLEAKDGINVFVRYSTDPSGANYTKDWTIGQNYLGIATALEEPKEASEYTWVRISDLEAISVPSFQTVMEFVTQKKLGYECQSMSEIIDKLVDSCKVAKLIFIITDTGTMTDVPYNQLIIQCDNARFNKWRDGNYYLPANETFNVTITAEGYSSETVTITVTESDVEQGKKYVTANIYR